ncbi:hypothetical protein ACTFIZ_008164 [Dictyostelium cf. discoideum]
MTIDCNPNVTISVYNNLKLYASISVSDAMKSLATVGDLLKVSNAASLGYPCSISIKILSEYQSLITDTVQSCSDFAFNCISTINQHELTLHIPHNFQQKAMAMIGRTSEKAKQMAEQSQNLVDLAKKIVGKSTEVVILATGDKNDTISAEREKLHISAASAIAEAILKACCNEIEKILDNENKIIDEIKKESNQTLKL